MNRQTRTTILLGMLLILFSIQLLLSYVHALPVTEEYDYGDNNTSDVDASDDKGTHSNFTGQQYGPDGMYDTLTEADSGGNVTLDLYVDIFDNTRTGWATHGTAPYLHSQDYPTDYVWLVLDRTESIGDFAFQNSSKSLGTINSVILRVYAWKEDSRDRLCMHACRNFAYLVEQWPQKTSRWTCGMGRPGKISSPVSRVAGTIFQSPTI
ncbi:MAG: hypothetical protein JSV29_00055 [Candidatus Bathyarchaeota archaeon]|nr:MAG: hypothetical protein JSV29_00055 [Candidatus Bathyarchaeota archaeon]